MIHTGSESADGFAFELFVDLFDQFTKNNKFSKFLNEYVLHLISLARSKHKCDRHSGHDS